MRLDNLRAAAAWCLFGYPNSTASLSDSPCVTSYACGDFAAALEDGGPTASPYGYCDDDWPADYLEACQDCLALGNERFMSNCESRVPPPPGPARRSPLTAAPVFTALEAGCEQRPAAASTLALAGSLFASAPVNITTPVASSSATAAAAPPSRGLSLGGEVGIAVGSAVAVAVAVGFAIIWRGKRRRRTALARLAAAAAATATAVSPSESRRPFMAPDSARTPVWTDDSPQSARGETSAMLASSVAGFSPYQSPYQSPVSPGSARAKGKDREPVDAGFEMARLPAAADAPPIIRPPPAPTIPRRASAAPSATDFAR